jgi:hypothetical protein
MIQLTILKTDLNRGMIRALYNNSNADKKKSVGLDLQGA